jgi:hypothetical protein
VSRDACHRAPVLLARKPIHKRDFGDGLMGFRDAGKDDCGVLRDALWTRKADPVPNLRAELTAFASQI